MARKFKMIIMWFSIPLLFSFIICYQNGERIFTDDNFEIKYSVKVDSTSMYISGIILHRKTRKAAVNTNIWQECSNPKMGTVPSINGEFKLGIPDECSSFYFQLYPFNKVNVNIK